MWTEYPSEAVTGTKAGSQKKKRQRDVAFPLILNHLAASANAVDSARQRNYVHKPIRAYR
jgi:hypothetical protein